MTVRLIPQTDAQNGHRRALLLGVMADYGKVEYERDGLVLCLDEPIECKQGKIVNIPLPHTVKVLKGVLLVSVPYETMKDIEVITYPPTLSVGQYDDINIRIKTKKDCTITRLLKLHLLELAP